MSAQDVEDPGPGLDELPDPVRRRVVALAAEVLPGVTPLPPALQKVALFAPARRARAGATAIEAALGDDGLRRRVATLLPPTEAAEESAEDGDGAAADPVALAAVTWLGRPTGWPATLADLLGGLRAPGGSADGEVARLREQVAALQQSVRDARAEQRDRVRALKEENADLRRKLGEARATLRRAVADREAAETGASELRDRAALAARQADAELRRLRTRTEQLTRELRAARQDDRTSRDEATVRARLLLDTVVEAAAGLRRELALPHVPGVPADSVRLDDARDDEGGLPGARPTETAESLERLLALPRARLLVDGYNVSKAAWPSSSLEAQRVRLLAALAPVVARTGAETTVVFDAHRAGARPVVRVPRGVRVVFSPVGVIADDVLRQLVAAEPTGRPVVAVTSDRALGADLQADGARVVPAGTLVALLG